MDGLILLREARRAGLEVSTNGAHLIVQGPRRLEAVATRVLAAKRQVMQALAAEEQTIVWRVDVMRPQVPPHGGIPLLVARPGIRFALGTCGSCGDPLESHEHYRCRPCIAAIIEALAAPERSMVTA